MSKKSSRQVSQRSSKQTSKRSAKRTSNQRTRSHRPFRVGRSKTGFGLFATEPIDKGGFITYYSGRKLPNAVADQLTTRYLFEINSRWTIDGSSRRNLGRYINHSCRPNADAEIKKHKILIKAIRTIRPGDEITYNYGRTYFNVFIKPGGCKCAACDQKRMVLRSPANSGTRNRTRNRARTQNANKNKNKNAKQ